MSDIYIEIDILPKGWSLTSIGSFANVLMGQSPPSETYNEEGVGLPFFQGKAEFTELHPVVRKWCNSSNKIAEPNDILMSVRAPVGASNIANLKCCIGRGLSAIRYSQCNLFLFYFFRLIEKKLDEKGTGTTFRAISGDIIKNAKVYLPPLAEQHRIVAKIEELFSELDKGVETLKTAQEQLNVYRQAVLKYAFEGKLTNPDVKDSELPEGWVVKTIGDLTQKSSEKAYPEKNSTSIFLGMDSLEPHSTKPHMFYKFSEMKSSGNVFFKNQVLYGRMRPYLNKVWVADRNGVASGEFIILSCVQSILPHYLLNILHDQEFVKYANSKTSGDRPRISYDEIVEYQIALPSLKEQELILDKIDSRLSVCDKIEESIEQGLQKAEALRQSILKKAFEGKLVSQDPNDEPASVLLERIKAERNNASPVKKTKTKKTKAKYE